MNKRVQIGTGILITGVLLLCAIVASRFQKEFFADSHESSSPSVGLRNAPDFELSDSQGKLVSLESFKGIPIVIHFWASWCPPCLDEIPQWAELAASMKSAAVRWIAVSLDQNRDDALRVLPSDRLSPNVVSLIDPTSEVSDKYGSYQFPETYLLNSQHQIIRKWIGPQAWSAPEIRNLILSVN